MMHQSIKVKPVDSWWDRRRFQKLPWKIYAGDPNWIPPILSQERELLGWRQHPFFDHALSETLVAERNGQVVGRLAVFVSHVHIRKYKDHRGFFGFFECINDLSVANALFQEGQQWLLGHGMNTMSGPVNPSLNYTCGLLVDGFDRPPCFLMTYNPPYYATLLDGCGFTKAQDMYAYEMDTALLAAATERYKPAVLSALEKSNLVLRPFHSSGVKYHKDIATYLNIYNRSLEGTWGFTPLQPGEVRHIARELRHVVVPQFAVFAELDGKPIGAVLALLDYNQIFAKLNGRLFPFGILRLMTGRKHITTARAMAMTMVPGHKSAGLSVVLMDNLVVAAEHWGIVRYEFSWVLESNNKSRGTLERLGTKITSTYRIYDKHL